MGHTHLPGIFSFDPATQQVTQNQPQDTLFNPHQRYPIKVGAGARPLYSKLASLQKEFSTDYQQGLIVKFFGSRKDEGEPVVIKTVLEVDANWSKEPAQGVDENEFSTTWTGFIKPRESVTYEFKVELDDDGDITFPHSDSNSIQGNYKNNIKFELSLKAGTFYPSEIKHMESMARPKPNSNGSRQARVTPPSSPRKFSSTARPGNKPLPHAILGIGHGIPGQSRVGHAVHHHAGEQAPRPNSNTEGQGPINKSPRPIERSMSQHKGPGHYKK